jgi:hypothetical protein
LRGLAGDPQLGASSWATERDPPRTRSRRAMTRAFIDWARHSICRAVITA